MSPITTFLSLEINLLKPNKHLLRSEFTVKKMDQFDSLDESSSCPKKYPQ